MRTDFVSSNNQTMPTKKNSSNINFIKSNNSMNSAAFNSNSEKHTKYHQHNHHHQKEKLHPISNNLKNDLPSLLKSNRSSSLPLKIVFNQNLKQQQQQQQQNSPVIPEHSMANSWSGNTSFMQRPKSNSFDRTRSPHYHLSHGTKSIFLPYKYPQLSMSEHFLNLIGLDETKQHEQITSLLHFITKSNKEASCVTNLTNEVNAVSLSSSYSSTSEYSSVPSSPIEPNSMLANENEIIKAAIESKNDDEKLNSDGNDIIQDSNAQKEIISTTESLLSSSFSSTTTLTENFE